MASIEEFKEVNSIFQNTSTVYKGLDVLWGTRHGSEYVQRFIWDNDMNQLNQLNARNVILGLKTECRIVFSRQAGYDLHAATWIRQNVNNIGEISDFVRTHPRLPATYSTSDTQILIDALKHIYPTGRVHLVSQTHMNRLNDYSRS